MPEEASELWLLPEIQLLTQISEVLEAKITLRGSTAKALRAAEPDQVSGSSMFDFVPALSDVDLWIEDSKKLGALRSIVERRIPMSGFFRWEFSSSDEQKAYLRFSNLEVGGMDELHLKPGELQWENTSLPHARERSYFNPVWALKDIFYFARAAPEILAGEAGTRLKSKISDFGGRRLAQLLESDPGEIERTELEVLKYAVARSSPETGTGEIREYLGDLLEEFANSAPQRLARLVRLSTSPAAPVVTAVWPAPPQATRRFEITIRLVRGPLTRPDEPPALKRLKEAQIKVDASELIASPDVGITLDEPPDPCCGYRDFAAGRIELAWTSPSGGLGGTPRSLFVSVPEVVGSGIATGNLGGFLVPAYATAGHIAGARADHGLAQTMQGSRGSAVVAAVGTRSRPAGSTQ